MLRVAVTLACTLLLSGSAGAKSEPRSALAYANGNASLDLYVLPANASTPRRLTTSPRDEFSPSWSPDGRRIVYRVNPSRSDVGDIWSMRADGRGKVNLTRTPWVAEWSPAWSPDGRLIAYYSSARGQGDVWVMRPDGSGRRNVTRSGTLNEYPSWSPDARRLVFNSHRDGQFEVYSARLDGSRQVNLSRNAAKDQWPAWSPDGKLIAFMSERDGSPDVFVMRADGSGVRNLTGTAALEESHPAWLRDGRLTFTRHGETGPIELWAIAPSGRDPVRLRVAAEPVFVYDWR